MEKNSNRTIADICESINNSIALLKKKGCVIIDKENCGWGLSGITYSEEEDEFFFECKTLDELEEELSNGS